MYVYVLSSLQVKLSGKSDNPDTIWAGKGVLATCTGESVLRFVLYLELDED